MGRHVLIVDDELYGPTVAFHQIVAVEETIEALEKALLAEVERVRNAPVSDAELARVKAQVVASDVYERDSSFYQAMQIGIAETVGVGHEVLDEYLERIQAVTPEQVQAVAKKYLVDDGLTVAVLDPQPIDPNRPPRRGNVGGGHGH